MKNIIIKIIESWANKKGNVNHTSDIVEWINELNSNTNVIIKESNINKNNFWYFDKESSNILNIKKSFFSIKGLKKFSSGELLKEQPIIDQMEIGYLGIICKEIDGVINFLMQAKIEPGNINCVQISPTIQATKSNFTRKHGGDTPKYFEYFKEANKYNVIFDQIQSEQSSRFYKKRNRNIIIKIDEDIELYSNYKWMTLGQIKELMKIDNLVNMDTRTVISGIPFVNNDFTKEELDYIEDLFSDKQLFKSIFSKIKNEEVTKIYNYINDYKMFNEDSIEIVSLNQLKDWDICDEGVICKKSSDFSVGFYDIFIEGREVKRWSQPLFKANGIASLGLIICRVNKKIKFLVCAKSEVGCFDKIEVGPTIQLEPTHNSINDNKIESLFREKLNKNEGIKIDVLLSEEGGRFYHEQNRNIIIEVEIEELGEIPEGYFLVDFSTLNYLIQINNCLNIQLRNLLSLLEV